MGTRTCSTYLREPMGLHVGVNSVVGKWDDATISTGDVVKLGKLPDRAILTNAGLYRTEPGGDLTMRLKIPMEGASGTASTTYTSLLTSTASGTIGLAGTMIGYQISVSDHCIVKEIDLEIVNASASTTGTIHFFVDYRLDQKA